MFAASGPLPLFGDDKRHVEAQACNSTFAVEALPVMQRLGKANNSIRFRAMAPPSRPRSSEVEPRFCKPAVAVPNTAAGSTFAGVAQLVQSVCFVNRRLTVRDRPLAPAFVLPR